jgi:hypothetical protein
MAVVARMMMDVACRWANTLPKKRQPTDRKTLKKFFEINSDSLVLPCGIVVVPARGSCDSFKRYVGFEIEGN